MRNPPAFPLPQIAAGEERVQDDCGMTLRDYFAIRVLNEIVSQSGCWSGEEGSASNRIDQARVAYHYADAMLEARARQR